MRPRSSAGFFMWQCHVWCALDNKRGVKGAILQKLLRVKLYCRALDNRASSAGSILQKPSDEGEIWRLLDNSSTGKASIPQ